jgi:transposase
MTPLEVQLTERVEAQAQEIKLLREKVDLLIKRLFGRSSEKLDEAQLMLLLQGDDDAAKKDQASSRANPGALEAEIEKRAKDDKSKAPSSRQEREARVPEHLPAVDEVIEPDEVKADPQSYRHIGEEITVQLDYSPPRYFRRRIIRKKYVKVDEPRQPPIIAALHTLQERSIAGPGLLANIIVSKYCDHLPLYRQEQIALLRHDLNIPRQSMARFLFTASNWLEPIYKAIRTGVMAGGYMQGDETMIEYLQPGNGETKQGYFWTFKKPGGDCFFAWHTSRAAACLHKIIPADFSGTLQCDGYGAYPAFANQHEGTITLAACWAHVRRKFVEASAAASLHAGFILLQIQHLYRIEARLRESKAGPALREAVRSAQSRMIIERISKALVVMKRSCRHTPQSAMAKAINYTLTLWPMLQAYLADGRVEIDNNKVENAIRPTAIGKKNWLFIGEAEAGQRSAIFYTIIEACRRRGIDPFEYLRDVFTRMPAMKASQYAQLVPNAWAKERGTILKPQQARPAIRSHSRQAAVKSPA